MRFHTILLATDLTPACEAAVEVAERLAAASDAKLLVLHVAPGHGTEHMGQPYASLPDPEVPILARRLAAIVPADSQVPCEHRLSVGDPSAEILALARQEQVDLIVLGTRGRSGVARYVLGSVADKVLRHADCPVCVCRSTSP